MFFLMMIIMFFCGGMCAATSPCDGIIPVGEDVLVNDTAEGRHFIYAKNSEDATGQEGEGEGSRCPAVVGEFIRKNIFQTIDAFIDDGEREEFKKAALGFVDNILLPLGKGMLAFQVKQKLEEQFSEISGEIGALEGLQPPEVLKMPACRQSCYIKRILVKLQDVEESILVFSGGRFATNRTVSLLAELEEALG